MEGDIKCRINFRQPNEHCTHFITVKRTCVIFFHLFYRCLSAPLCPWLHMQSPCVPGPTSQCAPGLITQCAVLPPRGLSQDAVCSCRPVTCSTSLPAVCHRFRFIRVPSLPCFIIITITRPPVTYPLNTWLHPLTSIQVPEAYMYVGFSCY